MSGDIFADARGMRSQGRDVAASRVDREWSRMAAVPGERARRISHDDPREDRDNDAEKSNAERAGTALQRARSRGRWRKSKQRREVIVVRCVQDLLQLLTTGPGPKAKSIDVSSQVGFWGRSRLI